MKSISEKQSDLVELLKLNGYTEDYILKTLSDIMNKIVPEKSNGYLPFDDAIYYTDSKDTKQIEKEFEKEFKKSFKHITPNLKYIK